MDINRIIEREKQFIESICNTYQYDNNLRHILLLLIPTFILKYGIEKEQLIKNTFQSTRIIPSNEESKMIRAYYVSTPYKDGEEIKTSKRMVIQNYHKNSLVELIDNLTHEFNHAINSYINEIKIGKKYLYLRTGLTYRIYDKDNLSFLKKSSSYMLEEIINTKQTEDIINRMKNMKLEDSTLQNMIDALNSETNSNYNSNSYYLQSAICKQIMENRTFISTLEKLRINGDIYEIEKWFDDIVGEEKQYKRFLSLLNDIYELEIEYTKTRFFKTRILNKIKGKGREITNIIHKFNENVIFK